MDNIQIISEIVIPAIGFIIVYIIYPLIQAKIGNEKMQETMVYANILFNAAEEIFSERYKGVEKHEFVKDKLMKNKGVSSEDADLIIKSLSMEHNKIKNALKE